MGPWLQRLPRSVACALGSPPPAHTEPVSPVQTGQTPQIAPSAGETAPGTIRIAMAATGLETTALGMTAPVTAAPGMTALAMTAPVAAIGLEMTALEMTALETTAPVTTAPVTTALEMTAPTVARATAPPTPLCPLRPPTQLCQTLPARQPTPPALPPPPTLPLLARLAAARTSRWEEAYKCTCMQACTAAVGFSVQQRPAHQVNAGLSFVVRHSPVAPAMLTPPFPQAALDAHNTARTARGATALVWNDTLATYAQGVSQTCTFQVRPCMRMVVMGVPAPAAHNQGPLSPPRPKPFVACIN